MTWLVSHPDDNPVTHAFATEAEADRAAELLVRRGGQAVVWEIDPIRDALQGEFERREESPA